MGMKTTQAALVTGYSTVRVTQLEKDPTFVTLVADYREASKDMIASMTERMTNLSLDALDLLHDRLQENPENFSINALLEMVKTFADRTGHGPNQRVELELVRDSIDRPPRETHDEWVSRRQEELGQSVGTPARTTDSGNNRRLVS